MSIFQFNVSKSTELLVISLFVPQNENNVTSLVEFSLFAGILPNHILKNIAKNVLDSKNCKITLWRIFHFQITKQSLELNMMCHLYLHFSAMHYEK